MAKSKYEYVKSFEHHPTLLPNTYTIVRIDGHSFHRFTTLHPFEKPNDPRGLRLMTYAARKVMDEFRDIVMAYGQSDEYSFVLGRTTRLYGRRQDKIATNVVSLFTAAYVSGWRDAFAIDLEILPSFDARCVLYPTFANLRDYLAWRQTDCHINNLYNTAFWELVQNPGSLKSEREAEEILRVTDSGGKNEILYKFGINYNNIDAMYRKGTVLVREAVTGIEVSSSGVSVERTRKKVNTMYCDIIGDEFWKDRAALFE